MVASSYHIEIKNLRPSLRNRQIGTYMRRYSTYLFLFYNKIDIEELISSPNGLNLFGGAAVGAEHM